MAGKLRAAATSAKIWVAGGVAAGVAAFATAVGTATAKAASFENKLNEVRKTAGLNEQQFQALTKQLLEVQAELGTSQEDLAAIAAEAGRLGIEGSENIAEFTRTVSLISEATDVSAEQAAQGLAKITNAFGLPIEKAEALGSALNELSNQTVASTGDLIDALTRVGAAGSQLGLTADEVAGFSATLIDAGISARRAGTGLRTIFTRLLNESDKVAEQMGMTEDALVQAFEENGVEAVKRYLRALDEMEKKQRATAIEDVFGVEQSQKVQALVQNMGNLTKQISDAGEEMKEVDSLTAEFQATTKDVANEWSRLTAKLSSWVTKWGTQFTGVLESALASLNDMAGGANEFSRDLTGASERLERMDQDIELVTEFRKLKAEGKDTAQVLEEMQQQFPADFFRETADGIEVATGKLLGYLAQQRRMASQNVVARQTQAVRQLQEAWLTLQRARARAQQDGLSLEEWREYKKQIRQSKERIQELAPVLVDQFAENGKVAREELQKLAESVDLRSFVGLSDISEDEAIDYLIDQWREYRDAKEDAADAPDPGEEAGGESDDFESRAPVVDRQEIWNRVLAADESLQQLLDQEGLFTAEIQFRTEQFKNKIRDLRLELERGAMSQEQFNNRAQKAAKSYRGELETLIERLREAGLITDEVAKAAIKGFQEAGEHVEGAKESTENLGEALQDAARLTSGISELANSFGRISDEAEKALGGVSSLLDSVGRLIELKNEAGSFGDLFSSFSGAVSGVGAIVGAVGGLASLIGSSLGDSGPSDEKLRKQIQKNVDALRENTEALFESALIAGETSEEEVNLMQELVTALEEKGNDPAELLDLAELMPETDPDTVETLIDRINSRAIANQLDLITDESQSSMRGRISQILGGATDEQVAEGSSLSEDQAALLRQDIRSVVGEDFDFFDERVQAIDDNFGDFGESLEGVIEELNFRREELGASFEQLRSTLLGRLEDLGLGDSGFKSALNNAIADATPDELGSLEKELSKVVAGDQTLNEAIDTTFNLPTLEEGLGELSPEDFRKFLDQLETISGVGSGSGRGTRTTTQVQRTITEFQANQLLTFQQEQVFELRRITSILQSGLGVPDSAANLAPSNAGGGSGGDTYNVQMDITSDMSSDEVARKLETAFQQMN